jgi:tetratricopeptide (TPR) repeat protein
MLAMAVVDPYSLCPCGSGQKFKWCCHKVEAFAERSQRLYEAGQTELALEPLDEGLRKEPGNAWLLTRKGLILSRLNRPEEATKAIREVLKKTPNHVGALVMMTRLALETEGPTRGAAQLQQALSAFQGEARKTLAPLVKVVGAFLAESGDFPAAVRHLRLSLSLAGGEPDATVLSSLRAISNNPAISPWLKNEDALSPDPAALSGEPRDRFEQALGWAEQGLWSSAASAFETLSNDPVAGAPAERNAGFCRLWLADDSGAVSALRRYVARLGKTEEAVDVEALCQQVAPESPDDQIEHVQLTWPLRNRQGLLDALNADPTAHGEGTEAIDPDDPNSPEVDGFALLDRKEYRPTAGSPANLDQVPRVIGRVLVGQDMAVVETYDDGRLDRLSERFTTIAGTTIAPAHPKTKVLGRVPRLQLALTWEWLLPEGTAPEDSRRLNREHGARLIRDVWPTIPMSFFRGRTPLQAAAAGDAEVPLRAAVALLENSHEPWRQGFDFKSFRVRLGIPEEPEIDPETVDTATIHLARLSRVPADRLSDRKLATLYRRAHQGMLQEALEASARALVARPGAIESEGLDSLGVYTDLATIAAATDRRDEAIDWVRRGRQADSPAVRARHAPQWDMFELRLNLTSQQPETWVPELAVLLDRYRDDAEATQLLMMNLIDMGLLEVVSHPERPGEILLDSRPLQALMSQYGPRVTTSTGRLGVSATRPEIWTPGSAGGGGGQPGGLWTPGATSGGPAPGGGGAGDKKNIIITGR